MPFASSRLRNLNWNLLRTFLVIVEERSLTRAAERLSVRQPTVTASLQKLEETLGAQLIQRDSRRFVLTQRGEALRQECQEIWRRVERIGEHLTTEADDLTGTVRLMLVTALPLAALDDALALMHRQHPAVTLTIDVANSQDIVRAIARGTVPFGLCLLQKPLAGLDCRYVLREAFGIYCGRSHPLFGRDDVTLETLQSEPFVAFTCGQEGSALEPMVALREGARLGARVAGLSAHVGEVARMIAAGLGIGILPVPATEGPLRDQLWRFPILTDRLGADLYLVSNPARPLDPAERAFIDLLESLL